MVRSPPILHLCKRSLKEVVLVSMDNRPPSSPDTANHRDRDLVAGEPLTDSIPCAVMGAFRLELRAHEETVFPGLPVEAVHGALHQAVGRVDPEFGRRMHEASPSSLVCSPLLTERGQLVGRSVPAGARVSASIAALDGRTLLMLLSALDGLRWRGLPVMIERPFAVEGVMPLRTGGAFPWIAYRDLAALATPSDRVALRFVTPTYFRSAGAVIPHPEPARVFGSHLRRWRAFAGFDLPELDQAALERHLAFDGPPEGRIVPVSLFKRAEEGFVGVARYRVEGSRDVQRGIATLAAYAALCGTGARTALGMGQTIRLA